MRVGYYPFGMMMPGRKYSASDGYRYGFNGKENDNDVKGEGYQIDYGERIYDPRLGRFYSVDPMYKDFPELTTYQYGSNNPIFNIDLDGLEGFGGAEKVIEQGGKTILKVATKYGVEQGAKVVAMKATEKIVTSPEFWSKIGAGLGWLGAKAAGVVGSIGPVQPSTLTFPGGAKMPLIGFGTYKVDKADSVMSDADDDAGFTEEEKAMEMQVICSGVLTDDVRTFGPGHYPVLTYHRS
ncbi:MAG: hypothetical protein EOP04_30835 [Proteobacteria bacterium]|nr:MAG: hypothetical protein EOP04_30835 [Pseudomonadota bacterium]